jgi:hypothetical protein
MNSLTNHTNWFDRPDSEYEKWVLEHILNTLQMTTNESIQQVWEIVIFWIRCNLFCLF